MAIYENLTFDVSDAVRALGLHGAYLAMGGLSNRDVDPVFEDVKRTSLERILAGLSADAIQADPILQGYRDLHTAVGFSNRNFVAAPENLLLNLLRTGQLPHVNLLVDIYNLVSIETRLALGAHDINRIVGNVHLRMTTGAEGFWPLGAPQAKSTRPGGYAYVDDANDVLCMLEVRQVEKTKATLETAACFYIVQGNAMTDAALIQSAVQRLIDLTRQFCGGGERLLSLV